MNTLKTYIKAITLLFLFAGILFSCQKDKPGPVDTAKDDDKQVEKPAKEAPKDPDMDFVSMDPKAIPVLNAYLEAYQYAVTEWKHKENYDLRDFIFFLSVGDSGKSKAAYLVLPPQHGYKGNISDVVQTEIKPADGAITVRMHDPELRKKIVDAIGQGWYTGYNNRFLAFNVSEQELSNVGIMTDIIIHEGFHIFPQSKEYKDPNPAWGAYRFNVPKDYPHDAESFGLMFAGHKIAELAVQSTDRSQLREYAIMFHVILQRLKANDTSKEKLIENYFIPFQWVEGSTSYITHNLIKDRNFYKPNNQVLKPFETFSTAIKKAIDEKITGVTFSTSAGVQTQEAPYLDVVDSSAYMLGVWFYAVLDLLGHDVFRASKAGKGIDAIYEDYIAQNNVKVDEEAVLESIKTGLPDFDWEAVTETVREYVKLWDNPDSATSSYTIHGKLRSKSGHAHMFCQPNRWLDRH